MAEALYRKYRPQIFEDVVGQEHIERTIKNAINQDKVSHAYLFTGPRGTGKTTTARLLAKALLCEHGPTSEPDGTCHDCEMIAKGEHPDVYELDAASRTGVENVREEIIGRVQYAPTRGRYKVYIVDEVHMLSTAAFNALLKTLEEPPSHVVFILCTTDPQKVPETIHSRCQRFDFRRIASESIVSRLGAICVAEDVEFEGAALELVAHRAEGGMRNALTSLEQLIAFGEGHVTLEVAERMLGALDTNDMAEIVAAIGKRDVATCFRWTAEYIETGADLAQFTRDLAEHVRNMYVLTLVGADVALEVGEAVKREMVQELQWFGADRLTRLLSVLGDLSAELKTSTNPRLSFEIALTRMVRPDSDLTMESLAERIEALESGYSAVAHVTAAPVAAASVAASAAGVPKASPLMESRGPASSGAASGNAPVAQPDASVGSAPNADAFGHVGSSVGAPASESPAAAPRANHVASTSVQEPTVAAAVAGADVSQIAASLENPAALQRIWQAALVALKKNKAAYGVLFLNTKATYDAAKKLLVVDFPAENAFAFKAVQKPDVQDAVLAALVQACGVSLPFVYSQGSATSVAASAAPSSAPSSHTAAPTASVPPVEKAPLYTVPASVTRAVSSTSSAAAVAGAAPQAFNTSAAPTTSFDAPPYEDDYVPYDDVVPYADEAPSATSDAPSSSTGSLGGSSSRSSQQSAPAPAATQSAALPHEADARASSVSDTAPTQTSDDLMAILSAGFGTEVSVEEIR